MNDQPCRPRFRRVISTLALFLGAWALKTRCLAAFVPGDVYWVQSYSPSPYELMEVTGGGSLTGVPALANVGNSWGQIAWSADLSTAYVPEYDNGRVVAISSTGVISVFATGISAPTGLLRTSDNRLLVVSFGSDAVFDITAGGNFAGATNAFATGFSQPRNLLQTDTGRILLADQQTGKVYDITAGGHFSGDLGFAYGFSTGLTDLAQDAAGHIYLSNPGVNAVWDITTGGGFNGVPAFATGRAFSGLTIDGSGRLLANAGNTGDIYNITAGGDFSSASPFAFNLPGKGDSVLDTVAVPEPSSCALLLCGFAGLAALRRKRR